MKDEARTPYAEALREARGARPMRQVATALGLSVQYYCDLENGNRKPLGKGHDAAVSRTFGLEPERLAILRAHATGALDVSGLTLRDVERLFKIVVRVRVKS